MASVCPFCLYFQFFYVLESFGATYLLYLCIMLFWEQLHPARLYMGFLVVHWRSTRGLQLILFISVGLFSIHSLYIITLHFVYYLCFTYYFYSKCFSVSYWLDKVCLCYLNALFRLKTKYHSWRVIMCSINYSLVCFLLGVVEVTLIVDRFLRDIDTFVIPVLRTGNVDGIVVTVVITETNQ